MPPPEERVQTRHPQILKSTSTDAPNNNSNRTLLEHIELRNNHSFW